jgi:hypothetical protein
MAYKILQWGFLASRLIQEYAPALWHQALLCRPSCKFLEGHSHVDTRHNSEYVVQGVPNAVQDVLFGKIFNACNRRTLYLWPPAAIWESCGCTTIGVWSHFNKKWFKEQATTITMCSAVGLTKEEWKTRIRPLPTDRRLLEVTRELIDNVLCSKHVKEIVQAHGWMDLCCCNNLLTLANAV